MSRGHIRRRGRQSWELKFDLGVDPRTGKRQTRYHSFKGSKREAQAELTRLLSTMDMGSYVDISKVTVADFLDRWERDWASMNVSPKTFEYRQLIKLNVIPHIGSVSVQKIADQEGSRSAAGCVGSGEIRSDRRLRASCITRRGRLRHCRLERCELQ